MIPEDLLRALQMAAAQGDRKAAAFVAWLGFAATSLEWRDDHSEGH